MEKRKSEVLQWFIIILAVGLFLESLLFDKLENFRLYYGQMALFFFGMDIILNIAGLIIAIGLVRYEEAARQAVIVLNAIRVELAFLTAFLLMYIQPLFKRMDIRLDIVIEYEPIFGALFSVLVAMIFIPFFMHPRVRDQFEFKDPVLEGTFKPLKISKTILSISIAIFLVFAIQIFFLSTRGLGKGWMGHISYRYINSQGALVSGQDFSPVLKSQEECESWISSSYRDIKKQHNIINGSNISRELGLGCKQGPDGLVGCVNRREYFPES